MGSGFRLLKRVNQFLFSLPTAEDGEAAGEAGGEPAAAAAAEPGAAKAPGDVPDTWGN